MTISEDVVRSLVAPAIKRSFADHEPTRGHGMQTVATQKQMQTIANNRARGARTKTANIDPKHEDFENHGKPSNPTH